MPENISENIFIYYTVRRFHPSVIKFIERLVTIYFLICFRTYT